MTVEVVLSMFNGPFLDEAKWEEDTSVIDAINSSLGILDVRANAN